MDVQSGGRQILLHGLVLILVGLVSVAREGAGGDTLR
jgi:hypothetical protein